MAQRPGQEEGMMERLYTKFAAPGFRVLLQKFVDHGVKFHHTAVLP